MTKGVRTMEDINQLWKKYKERHDAQAKEALIVHYVELVKIVAGRLYNSKNRELEFDDLVSFGIIGLIDAIEKFDISKNVKFETYANIRIRGAIIDQIRSLDWIPRSARQKYKDMEEAIETLQSRTEGEITEEMIAGQMDLSVAEFNRMLGEFTTFSVVSLEEKLSESAGFNPISDLQDYNPEASILDKDLKDVLMKAIDQLPERERLIVSLYYYSELTYKEIAEVLEISESRISQLHTKAILKLKAYLNHMYD